MIIHCSQYPRLTHTHTHTHTQTLFYDRFGMSVNADSVLRSVYYKYVHPKEVFIAEGILVPDIARKKNTATLGGVRKSTNSKGSASKPITASEKLPFVYPYGASINVQVQYD